MKTKICSKCKIEKPIEDFDKHNSHKDGLRSECKKCHNEWKRQYRLKNKEKIREKERKWETQYSQRPIGRFLKYKKGAKRRKIEWNLTKEQFMIFWQKPCYYCGELIKTIGLDRLNNLRGYKFGNVVSCCSRCNYAKRKMSPDEFIGMCRKVIQQRNT